MGDELAAYCQEDATNGDWEDALSEAKVMISMMCLPGSQGATLHDCTEYYKGMFCASGDDNPKAEGWIEDTLAPLLEVARRSHARMSHRIEMIRDMFESVQCDKHRGVERELGSILWILRMYAWVLESRGNNRQLAAAFMESSTLDSRSSFGSNRAMCVNRGCTGSRHSVAWCPRY